MPHVLSIKQHKKVVITLRSDFSLYDGKQIFRVTRDPSHDSRRLMKILDELERAYCVGDRDTIGDLMDELQSNRLWLFANETYIPYRLIGVPCLRQGVIRFRDWPHWETRDFPKICAWNDFPELARGHDLAELPDDGYDFAELRKEYDRPELIEQD